MVSASPIQAQALKPEDIYQKLLPSVLTLRVDNEKGENFIGTAFLALDANTAVTAWHVVSDATNVMGRFSDGTTVRITGLIDKDEKHDLALVRLASPSRPTAQLSHKNPPIGSRAYAIGSPKGFEFSITDGLISQIQKIHGSEQYQISCPISGGNSGGPVVNEKGEVLGVVAWTKTDAQNLNFAIPAGFVLLLNPHNPLKPWTACKESAAAKNLKDASMAAYPLKPGNPMENVFAFRQLLKKSAGKNIIVTVSEDGREKQFDLVLPNDFVR